MDSFDKVEQLKELLLGDTGLLVSLRLGDGLDNEKVMEIINILKKLKLEWEKENTIPKKAVDLFIDFYPVMESASVLYSDNESNMIMDAADKIMDLIRDCILETNY